jgi:hypothetical protein
VPVGVPVPLLVPVGDTVAAAVVEALGVSDGVGVSDAVMVLVGLDVGVVVMDGVGLEVRVLVGDRVLVRVSDGDDVPVRVPEGVMEAVRVDVGERVALLVAVGVIVDEGEGGGVAHFHVPASTGFATTTRGAGQVAGHDPTSALDGHVLAVVASGLVSNAVGNSTAAGGQAVQSYCPPQCRHMAQVPWHGWHVRTGYPAGSAQKLSNRQRLAQVPDTPAFSFSVTRSPGQRVHRDVVPGLPSV